MPDQPFFLAKEVLRRLWPGFKPLNKATQQHPIIASGTGGAIVARSGIGYMNAIQTASGDPYSSVGEEIGFGSTLPADRMARYALLEEMSRSPTVNTALMIHIAHALSVDKRNRTSFTIKPKDPADAEAVEYCKMLNDDLGAMIDKRLPSWALLMSIYGVAYIRPHAEHGRGIVSLESSYFCLPQFVREFERAGELVAFDGDYITAPGTNQRILAEPWELVPMKTPFWIPDYRIQPLTLGNKQYSLMQPPSAVGMMETQDYGMSFLASAYEPWRNMQTALKALLANRHNSGRFDRLIALATNELDPANAARYTREVTQSLARSTHHIQTRTTQNNNVPTTINHVIPVMSGGKGGITVDTQSISPDINGIEDVMFWVRQLGASVGVDSTMLGWADQMSGGLGEGGWIQTAVQAALRAEWIRKAATETIMRLINIHSAYKFGRFYLPNELPFVIEYNSLNTAIQEQENRERDSQANFVAMIASVLDSITANSKIIGSPTTFRWLFGETLGINEETLQQMLTEFAAIKDENPDAKSMMESAPELFADLDVTTLNDDELLNLVKFALRPAQQQEL